MVIAMVIAPTRLAAWGGVLGVPWCCAIPAVLSASGFGGGLVPAGRGWVLWFSLAGSLTLIAWAIWLVWIRKQGATPARKLTLLFTAGTVSLWLWRLGGNLGW
jgi:hypothetical protein